MSTATPSYEPAEIAAEARSILSCPAGASLVVQGVEDAIDDDLGLIDDNGTPVFLTMAGSLLERAALSNSSALLRVSSSLNADRAIVVAGQLTTHHRDRAGRVVVELRVAMVSLVDRREDGGTTRHLHVSADEFTRPELRLNRGYLHRSLAHANECHQDELRSAVSMATGTRPHAIAGVHLFDLTTDGVSLSWVDATGAHQRTVAFDRAADTPEELAELLSRHLHAGLC
ncbi:hypothetical protein NODU109028_15080 [Nocardioides dubius]|uniref:DUF2470 domain-containing protein n=1 Tax=Nocardioides dubius TaxID=317019 RepID=A0ABN1U2U1_9ACTN